VRVALLAAAILMQAPAAFDVASIKVNNYGAVGEQVRFFPPSGRVTMTNVTVRRMIINAYQLQDQQLAGGPGWITSDHFDINANSDAANLSPMDRWMMVRALLADRFKLRMHTEPRELSVFALIVGRRDGQFGERLKAVTPDFSVPTVPRPFDPSRPGMCGVIMGGPGRIDLRGVTMDVVAAQLSDRVGRLVVDRTGLTGRFDFAMDFAPQALRADATDATAPDSGPSIFTAVQEQTGLKLDTQKLSVDVTVIDSIEHPTEG